MKEKEQVPPGSLLASIYNIVALFWKASEIFWLTSPHLAKWQKQSCACDGDVKSTQVREKNTHTHTHASLQAVHRIMRNSR